MIWFICDLTSCVIYCEHDLNCTIHVTHVMTSTVPVSRSWHNAMTSGLWWPQLLPQTNHHSACEYVLCFLVTALCSTTSPPSSRVAAMRSKQQQNWTSWANARVKLQFQVHWVQKDFGSKKIFVWKICFGQKKIFGPKNVGSKKNCGSKKLWFPK